MHQTFRLFFLPRDEWELICQNGTAQSLSEATIDYSLTVAPAMGGWRPYCNVLINPASFCWWHHGMLQDLGPSCMPSSVARGHAPEDWPSHQLKEKLLAAVSPQALASAPAPRSILPPSRISNGTNHTLYLKKPHRGPWCSLQKCHSVCIQRLGANQTCAKRNFILLVKRCQTPIQEHFEGAGPLCWSLFLVVCLHRLLRLRRHIVKQWVQHISPKGRWSNPVPSWATSADKIWAAVTYAELSSTWRNSTAVDWPAHNPSSPTTYICRKKTT